MSSGFGLKGRIGRCYPYYADFMQCVQNVEDESPNVCTPEKMDYFECLHHKKEYARMAIIKKTAAKLEADRISGGVHH